MILKHLGKLVILLFFILFIAKSSVFADSNFNISSNTSYEIASSGVTHVVETIEIENKKEFVYTPSYKLSFGIKDLSGIKVYKSNGSLRHEISQNDSGGKSIEVFFDERIVGIGNKNTFNLEFDTTEIAKKEGGVWRVNIPGLSSPQDFTSYNATLFIPKLFGKISVSKPKLEIIEDKIKLDKNQIGKSGIFLLFGNEQYYKLNLKYHLENPNLSTIKTEIAIPPPTNYQEVRIKKIVPTPETVYEDTDGNWLAVYSIPPKTKLNITLEQIIKVYAAPFRKDELKSSYTSSDKYWETLDPEIQKLALELKTPENIYNYIVSNLTYSYDKVTQNNLRLGAKGVLQKKDFAVCLEFSDLFIALARAANINAREVEGYAHTENSKLRPLSLIKDILHAWPEYYDREKNQWIMIDPTWGNTTSGMDYFNSFDFDHITFVINGKKSGYPVPAGGYKLSADSKDVDVTIADKSDFDLPSSFEITQNFPKNALSGFPVQGSVFVRNTGSSVIENQNLYITFQDIIKEYKIEKILPFEKKEILITLNKTPFLTNKQENIKIQLGDKEETLNIQIGFFPNLNILIIGGIISAIIIFEIITVKTWSLYFQKRQK